MLVDHKFTTVLLSAAAFMFASCSHVYHVDKGDYEYAQKLNAGQAELPKDYAVLQVDDISMPAKRQDGEPVSLRLAALEEVAPLGEQALQGTATDWQSAPLITGLSIMGAGLVAFLGYTIDGQIKADQEGIGKYASDGVLSGSILFSLTALVGGPLVIWGLLADDPEVDAPMPSSWPSMQSPQPNP